MVSVIFNLFLVAVALVFRNGLPPNARIPINFRFDGNYSISDGCAAKTEVSTDTIFDLQYADDAAIPSHTAAGLQHSLDLLAATYQRAGLIVNTKKTEVLAQSVNTSSAARACERSWSGRNFRSPLTPLSVTPAHRSAPHRGVSMGGPIIALKNIVAPVPPENIRKR